MWYNLFIIIALVILSGTFAGLTLALFSIKLTTLERKIKLGDQQAKKIYEIRQNGNLLLCTLLLGNVSSYTIMTVFLGSITSGMITGFVAISLIFIFGEILPQAVFPRHALWIGAKLSLLVWLSLVIFYPIAAPIAWILDRILGKEPPVLWSKEELGEIIKYHKHVGKGIIDKDEERIILGALSFSDQSVQDIMIPREHIFFIEAHTLMSKRLLNKIKKKGFSRIPVYDSSQNNVVGLLYSKNLIGLSVNRNYMIDKLCSKENVIIVKESTRLDNLLNLMVRRKMYMVLVIDQNSNWIGVATMEDIMEEILKMELEDQKT